MKGFIFRLAFASSFLFCVAGLMAQRPMERLDRSVVAQQVSGGVYINWRITSDEWYNTSYRLYRDGALIHETGLTGASNFLDVTGASTSTYTVTTVKGGVESAHSVVGSVNTKGYIEIPMRDLKALGKDSSYYLNDATAADLDGDGQMEIIIKRLNRNWSTANTNYTFFEAYKLDGTFLWGIDVGPNITMDVEINIAAFDFDGDGKAEVFMRTSDNTVFGDGKSVGDRDGDGETNYRYSIGGDGFMNAGPEYLSLIDGETGAELDWVYFIARGQSTDWGDDYGHRANKFFFGAPYLDGVKPSIFIGRGIYTQTKMATYDVVNKKLVPRWTWTSSGDYSGQGNHNYVVADVDGDGCDEIVWGSMCVDHNGQGLYTTALGHGDAMHVGDFDPYLKGVEVFACNEVHFGSNLREGATGKILMRHITPSDCGRCCAGNISNDFKGAEIWAGGIGASATDRIKINHFGVAENFTLYWDGDLLKEICDHRNFSKVTGVGYGQISKFINYGNIETLLAADAYSCNHSKGTPCLQADLIGDWREEVIWWRTDSMALRLYMTPYPTQQRIYTLLHDHQYRQAICWQMCAYNQPPHPSFYLGDEFPTPIPAKSTNGKLVWKGASARWNTSATNWMEGDDAAGLIAGTASQVPFANGRQVLLDTRGENRTLELQGPLSPSLLMVSGTADYTLSGSGSLTGAMRMDKLGAGILTLDGQHTYIGATDVWEGVLWMNGSLAASPVIVRRHAEYGGTGISCAGITTEYNASVVVGGPGVADSMTVHGVLSLVEGARLVLDLSDEPTYPEDTTLQLTGKTNDFLKVDTLDVQPKSVICVNKLNEKVLPGDYLIGQAAYIQGDLAQVKFGGLLGSLASLVYDEASDLLFLRIKGLRQAMKVEWSGSVDGNWDVSQSSNWLKEGLDDVFVSGDSVYFTSSGINRSITINDSLLVGHMDINSGLNYTFGGSGVLSGPMKLSISGGCTVDITNRNSFSGSTTVDNSHLIMKYAPSTTSNGGIGTSNSSLTSLVLKDSASLTVTTASEICNRGLTLVGSKGGIINQSNTLYWYGAIAGTSLTKVGTGALHLSGRNTGLSQTVLKEGSIKLASSDAVFAGVGNKVTLVGGTLDAHAAETDYLTSQFAIDVPRGASATFIAPPRCEINGALTGSGTLNWVCDYLRASINGDWSGFIGTVNVTPNSAYDNISSSNVLIMNNSAGMPQGTLHLTSGITLCYRNNWENNGTTTIKLGMLTGTSGATFFNAGLEVGANGNTGTFAGAITGVSSVRKMGKGSWTLSGANTYTGTTTISEGLLTLSGSKTGTGLVTVGSNGELRVYGTMNGRINAAAGSRMYVAGTLGGPVYLAAASVSAPGARLAGNGKVTGSLVAGTNAVVSPSDSSVIGTFMVEGDLTMNGAIYEAQVSGGSTAKSDKLAVTGTLTVAGRLLLKQLNTTPLIEGNTFQLFTAGSIKGTFTEVRLPTLSEGLVWDTTALYKSGVIRVLNPLSLGHPTFETGLVANPTDGLFSVKIKGAPATVHMTVLNLTGQTVYSAKTTTQEGEVLIDLRHQPNGFYLLRLESDNRTRMALKLIKNTQ